MDAQPELEHMSGDSPGYIHMIIHLQWTPEQEVAGSGSWEPWEMEEVVYMKELWLVVVMENQDRKEIVQHSSECAEQKVLQWAESQKMTCAETDEMAKYMLVRYISQGMTVNAENTLDL